AGGRVLMDDRLPLTAIHEAAHAVVALALGFELVDVELRPPWEDPHGVCRVQGPLEGVRGATVMFSGEVAAALASELPVPTLAAVAGHSLEEGRLEGVEVVQIIGAVGSMPASVSDSERNVSALSAVPGGAPVLSSRDTRQQSEVAGVPGVPATTPRLVARS